MHLQRKQHAAGKATLALFAEAPPKIPLQMVSDVFSVSTLVRLIHTVSQ